MIKLSYFPNLFIEAAVLFDQQGGCRFLVCRMICFHGVGLFIVSDWMLKREEGMLKFKMEVSVIVIIADRKRKISEK